MRAPLLLLAGMATVIAVPAVGQDRLQPVFSSDLVDGTIYVGDTDKRRILTDAIWIDEAGNLLLPAARLNRSAGLNGGVDAVQRPITLYKLAIGKKGVRR